MISWQADFLNTDGKKDFRKRDQEFENIIKTKEKMLKSWKAVWSCLFDALAQLND